MGSSYKNIQWWRLEGFEGSVSAKVCGRREVSWGGSQGFGRLLLYIKVWHNHNRNLNLNLNLKHCQSQWCKSSFTQPQPQSAACSSSPRQENSKRKLEQGMGEADLHNIRKNEYTCLQSFFCFIQAKGFRSGLSSKLPRILPFPFKPDPLRLRTSRNHLINWTRKTNFKPKDI